MPSGGGSRSRAAAATAGGRAVVKMKPEAKLRTKSHQRGRPGDVAADAAKGLAKRAFDHVDPVGQAVALRSRRRRGGHTCRRHGPRRCRSARHGLRRPRRSRGSGRCRRPSNRRIRRPRSSGRSPTACSLRSRSRQSLCFHSTLSAREWRMPSIMLAWFLSSDRITAFGMRDAERATAPPSSTHSPR